MPAAARVQLAIASLLWHYIPIYRYCTITYSTETDHKPRDGHLRMTSKQSWSCALLFCIVLLSWPALSDRFVSFLDLRPDRSPCRLWTMEDQNSHEVAELETLLSRLLVPDNTAQQVRPLTRTVVTLRDYLCYRDVLASFKDYTSVCRSSTVRVSCWFWEYRSWSEWLVGPLGSLLPTPYITCVARYAPES